MTPQEQQKIEDLQNALRQFLVMLEVPDANSENEIARLKFLRLCPEIQVHIKKTKRLLGFPFRISESLVNQNAIAKDVWREKGDQGTCCIGMRLRYKGMTVAEGIAQGNMTNYEYFDRLKAAYVAEGANENDFTIDDGYMD